jgi:hypothetical protein
MVGPTGLLESIWSNPPRRDGLLFGLVLAWGLVLFTAFQPGLMSWDSLQQYEQGLSGQYGNWHPPVVSLLNGIAGRLAGSPWPLLVGQLLAIGTGMALLARRAPTTRAAAALAIFCGFLVAPPVWSIGVTLWKDVLVGAALLGAVAALDADRPVLALCFTVLGTLCRHNAIVGVVPLALPAVNQLIRDRRGRLVAGAAVVGLLAVAPKLAERALGARDEWTLGALLVFDEIAVYSAHPDLLAASPLHEDFTVKDLQYVYSPASCQPIFSGGPEAPRITGASLPPRRQQIRAEWVRVVRADPLAYARHRLLHFRSLVGADGNPVCYPFHVGIHPGNPWGFKLREDGAVYRGLRRLQDRVSNTFLFRGWFWMLALPALAATAWRRRAAPLAIWTAASGWLYGAAYLLIGVVCDFRYLYWSVLATFAAAALSLRSERGTGATLLQRT